MTTTGRARAADADDIPYAPTEDELPSSDGEKLESERQGVQINLLAGPAKRHFAGREDVYVGADMIVYFSLPEESVRAFRGPDLFVVTCSTPSRASAPALSYEVRLMRRSEPAG